MSLYNIVVSSNESTVVAEYVAEYDCSNSYQSEAKLEQDFIIETPNKHWTFLP